MMSDRIGLSYNMAFMGYGDKWRLCRKITQQLFRQGAMDNFNWVIARKVHQALGGLLSNPDDFAYHNKMCVPNLLIISWATDKSVLTRNRTIRIGWLSQSQWPRCMAMT